LIVGGGAAGIGAARRLAQTNLSTLLLEADSRLGGRAWTREISGLRLDLGCGWFHSAERNAWIALARAAGVFIDRRLPQWRHQFRDLGFSPADQARAGRSFAAWMQRLEHATPRSDCAADALDAHCEWNDYIRAVVGFISGASLECLSIADYRAYDEASSDDNWRVPTGYGALVAGSLPAEVALRLATPVQSIALDAKGIAARTPAGDVRARAAILTVSTAVLAGETLALPAGLEPWREAARSLPLGRNEKLFLEIVGDAPFETETQVLGNARQVSTASYYIRPLGLPVIECFFGGKGAHLIEESGPAAGFDFAIEQLAALFGAGIRGSLRPLAGSGWSSMPRIGGAYSYALPGHAAARNTLALPFENRLFFAGEATSPGDFSTAHGAHDSGRRAADEAVASFT
jgi:monoamine oxidase